MLSQSAFNNLLNPTSWYSHSSLESCWSVDELEEKLFDSPMVQIDFDLQTPFSYIKEALISIISKKGEVLLYETNPYVKLPDYTSRPVERHYDGISSSNPGRVPDWIFFVHSGFSEISQEASSILNRGFTISNCHLAYMMLSDRSKQLLTITTQLILDHLSGISSSSNPIFKNLSVNMIEYIDDSLPLLRGHIPFHDTYTEQYSSKHFYCYPDDLKIKFDLLSWADQKFLLDDIIRVLDLPLVSRTHMFQSHSLLAVHNKSCFHSGKCIQGGNLRDVFRTQLICL